MTTKQMKIPSNIRCESFLIGVLYLVGMLSLYEDAIRRGRPYVYPTILMVQLFIIKSWMRIPSNNTFHYFLFIKKNNDKLLQVCKLTQIPNRRTIDRRFQVLPIGKIISTMGNLFLSEKLVNNLSVSVDSSMLQAAGPVWHKSDIKKNRLPITGIDTEAKWGFSNSKGWVWGIQITHELFHRTTSSSIVSLYHYGKCSWQQIILCINWFPFRINVQYIVWSSVWWWFIILIIKEQWYEIDMPNQKVSFYTTRQNETGRILQFQKRSKIILSEKDINWTIIWDTQRHV